MYTVLGISSNLREQLYLRIAIPQSGCSRGMTIGLFSFVYIATPNLFRLSALFVSLETILVALVS